jgi:hypothetical protein
MKLIKYTLCGNLNSGRAMDDNDTDMMSNYRNTRYLESLYKSKSSTFGSDSYGKGLYIDRILLTRVKNFE